jgi:hypothetical protein
VSRCTGYDAHGEADGSIDIREFGWYLADQAGCDSSKMPEILETFEETVNYVMGRAAAT